MDTEASLSSAKELSSQQKKSEQTVNNEAQAQSISQQEKKIENNNEEEGQRQEQEEVDFIVLPSLSPEEEQQLEQEHREKLQNFYSKNKKYELDYWYEPLAAFTYSSASFPLTAHEAYIIHCLYYSYKLSPKDQSVKNQLVHKVNHIIKQNSKDQQAKHFMKLSTRSPKDNCWDYRQEAERCLAIKSLVEYLTPKKQQILNAAQTQQKNRNNVLFNYLYRFFLEHGKEKMAITNGEDFLRIFSHSERIITDLNDFSYLNGNIFEQLRNSSQNQAQNHDESNFDKELTKVWVRQWEDCEWREQFRMFYNNYKLTAICQYDQRCYFPELKLAKEQIKQRCLEFFQQMEPALRKIDMDKGVMDVIVNLRESNKPKFGVKMVEINVFDRDARASLFNWEDDKQILQEGPAEIRVLQSQKYISKAHLGSIMGMIDKNSTEVIEDALKELGLLHLWKQ